MSATTPTGHLIHREPLTPTGRTFCGKPVLVGGLPLEVTCRTCLGERRRPPRPGWRVGLGLNRTSGAGISGV